MDKLKPCPFCGGSDLRIIEAHWIKSAVICKQCGSASGCYDTEQQAIEAWNRRVENGDV